MTDTLKAFEKADQKLFEAQQEIKSLRVQVEQISRVNKEYAEVITPLWDYCKANVKVELGKSITEALIESHKLLQSQVWSLEPRCKLLEEDAEDTAKYVETQRAELAKANERIAELEERCHPSKVIMIGERGHYVSQAVFNEITQLRKEQENG